MPTEFHHQRRVGFAETDMAGIAHFSRFLVWMEETEHAFLRSLGLSVLYRSGDGRQIGLPRVSVACDYAAPVRFDDVLDVRLSVERRGAKSVTYRFEFRRGETLIAAGRSTCVCCRFEPQPDGSKRMESIPWPPEFAVLEPAPNPADPSSPAPETPKP